MNRWGAHKLLIISLIIGLGDWMLTVFDWGGHPTYVALETPVLVSPESRAAYLATRLDPLPWPIVLWFGVCSSVESNLVGGRLI